MELESKYRPARAGREDATAGRYTTVTLPLPYDGVGKALRASFAPVRTDLPSDMLGLLDKLDRH